MGLNQSKKYAPKRQFHYVVNNEFRSRLRDAGPVPALAKYRHRVGCPSRIPEGRPLRSLSIAGMRFAWVSSRHATCHKSPVTLPPCADRGSLLANFHAPLMGLPISRRTTAATAIQKHDPRTARVPYQRRPDLHEGRAD